jgi:hypothetical protein
MLSQACLFASRLNKVGHPDYPRFRTMAKKSHFDRILIFNVLGQFCVSFSTQKGYGIEIDVPQGC